MTNIDLEAVVVAHRLMKEGSNLGVGKQLDGSELAPSTKVSQ
jgi:hypothetical protein